MDMGLDERTLRRIAALLVAFAGLAESMIGRSAALRWLVLAILRYAEGAALDYLADATGLDWAAGLGDEPAAGSGPADAAILACRLRMLAGMLGQMLPPDGEFDFLDRWQAGRDVACHAAALCARIGLVAAGGWPHPAPDTS